MLSGFLVHLLRLLAESSAQRRIALVRHPRQSKVLSPDLHGDLLLCRIPVRVVGAFHRWAYGIVGGCHRLQRIRRTAGRFRGQQPSANSLQLGKICVPPAHRAVFRQGQLYPVPCQFLGRSRPAAVFVHHLPVVLAALFKAHSHLVQFRVLLPQYIIPLCAFLHDLLRHVQHKPVRLGPVHISAVQVIPQRCQTAGKGLCVHLAVRCLCHLPGNVQKAVIAHRGVLCQLHHLCHRLALGAAVPHALAARRLHILCVHIQLVSVFAFLRHKLCQLRIARVFVHHLDTLAKVC